MEFLGKMVRKEFKGFGVFDGVVDSYDSATGFFKILYEDGDSEEADFSEVARLVAATLSSSAEPIPEQEKPAAKRGRKPKRRRRNHLDPGMGSENLDAADSNSEQRNLDGTETGLGQNLVDEICVSGGRNSDDNVFDLNRGLEFDDVAEKVEIDLNLTVVNDEFDEVVGKRKEERGFDLNLRLIDENLNVVNETQGIDLCVGSELRNGGGDACCSILESVVDANHVNCNKDSRVKLEEGSPDVAPSQCEDGSSGRRKRRKVARNLTSPTETVLRRSARRASAMALNECNSSGMMSEDGANDLSVSGVTDESEEKPSDMDLERPQQPEVLPTKIELPPSSTNLNLEGIPVLDLFFVYSCLRSFSTLLYLSPFGLEDLVAALRSRVSNLLIDFIHVSILQTLRKHLEFLANEGCESASTCLRNMNWDLLDVITWPNFMVEYMLIHGSALKPGFGLDRLNLFDGDYYSLPASAKLELLRCLCDDVIEVDAIRSELSKRMIMADATMDIDRAMSNDLYRKRRISLGARGDSSLTEDMADEVPDGNSDECCLCKMDGNLICCDGCPAAYHTKCVGIVSNCLPEGDWHCPECMVGRFNLGTEPQKLIRGADLLGIDPYGRLYLSCFNYLLVSDSYDAESSFNYYHKDDLGAVIQLLRSYHILYGSILSTICQQWAIPTDLCELKSDLEFKNCKLNSGTLDGRKTRSAVECVRGMENPHTSSEGSAEILQSNNLIPSSPRPGSSEIAGRAAVANSASAAKQQKRNRSSAGRRRSILKTKEEDVIQGHFGDVYMNCYSFARTASSVVEELLQKPSDKVNADIPKTEEELISVQLKFILRKSTKFCWPTIQDQDVDRQKEECGWCYCCRFPVEGRECLFSFLNKSPVAEGLKPEVDALLSKKNKKGHLIDVVCCMLSMEQRLQGLLLGPWLSPQYGELWRKRVLKASDVLSLKRPLLMLESNLHPSAVKPDWWKQVDSVATMGSASHFVASSRATSRSAISRRKSRCGDSEIKSLKAAGGLGLFWWRGGKVSRSLFNWKVVPRSLALKAARNAGRIKIPGIQYPDSSESARRTKCVAWRAAVETSTSTEQLALQVRELDMFLRWDDIENSHPHFLLDKESIKSIRLFKKAIVRRKCAEGTQVKFLLDFGKRRSIPDVVIKHGIKVEDPSGEKKKYWLDESYVPLHLLKSFEERRITRKASKTNSSKARKVGRAVKKPLREKGFDYLFSRAERADSYQCGHCNKHVPISEAVSCHHCNEFFHKRHVTKSSEAVASGITYTCHRCRAGKHVKNESIRGKRKWGKLRDAKNVKVYSRRRLPKLRPKARENGKTLACHGAVLSRNRKMVQYQKKHSSLEEANVSTGMTLRRSARKATYIPSESDSSAGSKKRKRKRKRKRNKSTNVVPKESPKNSCCQKRRTRVSSFWINGLQLSKKPNDERVVQFKRRKLLVPSEFSADIEDPPKCSLCSEQGLVSSSMYIGCEFCGDWFHGDAFGLNEGNIECLIGFKCHVCRERSPPVCPFHDISRDTSQLGINNAQGSPEEVQDQKETDCVLKIRSDAVSSGLLEIQTAYNSDENVDHEEASLSGSELRIENGSPNSKVVIANSIESPNMDLNACLSTDSVQGFHIDDASLGQSEVQMALNLERNLAQDETTILDCELKEENGLPDTMKVTSNAIESQSGFKADSSTGLVQEFCSDDASRGCLDVQTVHKSVVNTDPIRTPLLDPALQLENCSPAGVEVIANLIESQSGDKADLSADCVQEFGSADVSPSNLEVQTIKVSAGNFDQVKTSILDPELSVVNELPACKEVIANAFETQNGDLEANFSPDRVSLSCSEVQTIELSVGDLDHVRTPIVNSEFRVENGSPASEVMFNAIESRSRDLKADVSTQEFQCSNVFLSCSEVQAEENYGGNLDQVTTPMLDFQLRVGNGSPDIKVVVSTATESQKGDLEVDN